jgi:hypothetical protein
MNDMAYDISHLLEVDSPQAETPAPRAVRAVPAVASRPARSSVAEAQEAMGRELLQFAPLHDALILQYLNMSGDTFPQARS